MTRTAPKAYNELARLLKTRAEVDADPDGKEPPGPWEGEMARSKSLDGTLSP